MSKHTPGPWKSRQSGDGKFYLIGEGQSSWNTHVAEVHSDDIDSDEADANARLIAAAPALLEACKKALFDSSLDRSETVLSAEVHETLNNAIVAAERCELDRETRKRVPSPPLGPRSWCFGQGPAEAENGYWDDACDNCECIDRCAADSKKRGREPDHGEAWTVPAVRRDSER